MADFPYPREYSYDEETGTVTMTVFAEEGQRPEVEDFLEQVEASLGVVFDWRLAEPSSFEESG